MITDPDVLKAKALAIRRLIIQQSYASSVGHIGSALSIADLMAVLWWGVMRHPGEEKDDRDRFILSKGHAALALYSCLRLCNRIDEQTMASYCRGGSQVCAHPMHTIPGVEISTGSLGQGLSVACGRAYALRHQGRKERVYVVMSDAEMNEGQVWEAAMFAGHHHLENLTVVLDLNGSQCLGKTKDILHLRDPRQTWESFGWNAIPVDGHDCTAMHRSMTEPGQKAQPTIYLAATVLGRGVSFMEDNYEWHYLNLSPETYSAALQELDSYA